VEGRLEFLGDEVITPEAVRQMMGSVTSEQDQETLRTTGQADYGFWMGRPGEARFRVSVIQHMKQSAPIMRFFIESTGCAAASGV
jgi:Tfp pilus assembly pilus retraction ATPase PilT